MVQKGASTLFQVQVEWSEKAPSLVTWEEVLDLHRRFPTHASWGQAAFQGRGSVRTISTGACRRKAARGRRADATVGRPTTEKPSTVKLG